MTVLSYEKNRWKNKKNTYSVTIQCNSIAEVEELERSLPKLKTVSQKPSDYFKSVKGEHLTSSDLYKIRKQEEFGNKLKKNFSKE